MIITLRDNVAPMVAQGMTRDDRTKDGRRTRAKGFATTRYTEEKTHAR